MQNLLPRPGESRWAGSTFLQVRLSALSKAAFRKSFFSMLYIGPGEPDWVFDGCLDRFVRSWVQKKGQNK